MHLTGGLWVLCAGFTTQVDAAPTARVSPGNSVILTCTRNNSEDASAQFTWSRQDGTSITGERFTISGNLSEVLQISPVQEGDGGVYICEVKTARGVLTGRWTVIVGMFCSIKN